MTRMLRQTGAQWVLVLLMVLTGGSCFASEDHKMSPVHDAHNKRSVETERAGSSEHDHQKMVMEAKPGTVGVDEKLGDVIPEDIRFKDEEGQVVSLGRLIDRPTILLPVYYECPTVCSVLMSSLAMVHKGLPKENWHRYRAVTVSFDSEDSPASASHARKIYMGLLDPGFPKENWRFLTGDQLNIDRFLNAIGYSVIKQKKHLFQHPNAIVIISADRKIIRYIFGTSFLPFDVGMALMEAERGTPGVSMKKILSYCFEYDPEEKRYTFQFIRIFGLVIPVLLFLFYFFFLRKGNKQRNDSTDKSDL